jgi:hypothetical protein
MMKHIHQAGLNMYQVDGMKGLKDPLVWLFIPKSWQRFIDTGFDVIGDWNA